MLIEGGHQVTGSTRAPARAIRLSQVGATSAVVVQSFTGGNNARTEAHASAA
jgi:hypothetical protein